MTPQLPPRPYICVDEETTRLATDEEYAEYLSIVIGMEGLAIVDETPAPAIDPAE
jgi:hypothetical protein